MTNFSSKKIYLPLILLTLSYGTIQTSEQAKKSGMLTFTTSKKSPALPPQQSPLPEKPQAGSQYASQESYEGLKGVTIEEIKHLSPEQLQDFMQTLAKAMPNDPEVQKVLEELAIPTAPEQTAETAPGKGFDCLGDKNVTYINNRVAKGELKAALQNGAGTENDVALRARASRALDENRDNALQKQLDKRKESTALHTANTTETISSFKPILQLLQAFLNAQRSPGDSTDYDKIVNKLKETRSEDRKSTKQLLTEQYALYRTKKQVEETAAQVNPKKRSTSPTKSFSEWVIGVIGTPSQQQEPLPAPASTEEC